MEIIILSYAARKATTCSEAYTVFFQTFPSWNDTPSRHNKMVTAQEAFTLDFLSLQGSEFFIPKWIAALAPQLEFAFGSNEH
jgi:hypothetical protein